MLVLTADYAPRAWSGIGTAVAAQAAAVARRGVEIDVLVPEDHPAASEAAAEGPPGVHRLTPARFPLRPEAFDAVHLHSLGLAELAFQLRSRFGLPLVYTSHALIDDELPRYGRSSGWSGIQDLVLARSDHVVFPSASERRAAVRRGGDLARRSSVHPNGLARAKAPSAPSPRTGPVVFAGRFAETKGVRLLCDVAALLAGHPAIRFVLAGGHGDAAGRRAVSALCARRPDRCRSVGWLPPAGLERLFRSASVVVVPSSYEPFGMVALEAMRAGAPVLAAATGGLRELVRPGSGGLLVRSRRPGDWRAAIVALWERPALRRELGRRGPAHVAEHYDADVLAEALVDDVYAPLRTRRRRARGVAA